MGKPMKYLAAAPFILMLGTWTVTRAQTGPCPGCLDPAFGTGGMTTTSSLTGGVGGTIYGSGMAVQRINGEDRVVAIGTGYKIARYLSNGSLDATFGTGGIVTRTYPKGGAPAHRVVVQPDNKLLVVGLVPTATKPTNLWTVAVTRYMPNGQYDTEFGPDHTGTVMLAPQGVSPQFVLQSDGKIVVAGAFTASPSPDNLYVIRLETNGRFDLGFGPAGNGASSFPGAGRPYSMTLQRVPNSEGVLEERIVVSTGIPYGSPVSYASVMRLTSTGSLDQTFNESGVAEMAVPGANSTGFSDIAVDASNRILAAGHFSVYSGNAVATHMLMARYLGDGTLDPSFGIDGTLRQDWVDCRAFRDVAIQPNGSILAMGPGLGGTTCAGPSGPDFVVWRFLEDGSPDPEFGSGGVVENYSANGIWGGMVLVRKPDGTAAFIVGGSAPVTNRNKTTFVWALWRYFY